jgi:hypothetical protein
MRLVKRIVLFSSIFLCCITVIISIIALYLFYHPERIQSMMERSLSAATGSSCSMESLSLTLKTLVIEARGVVFETSGPQPAQALKIPFIRADLAMGGPWGRRSLILENIRINGISLNFTLPANMPEEKEPSFPARMIQSLVGIFLFRDIIFQSGEILEGRIAASWLDQTIQIRQFHAKAATDIPLYISFAMEVNNASRKMQVTAPKVQLFSENTFDVNDLNLSGILQAGDITVQDANLGIREMGVQSKFIYSRAHNHLNLENLEVDIKGLFFTEKSNKLLPPIDVSLQAERVSTRYPVIEISHAALQVPSAEIHTGTRDIRIKDIRVHIPDGRFDTEQKSITLPKVRFDTVDLKNILLSVDLKDSRLNLILQGENIAILQAAAAYRLVPSDWDISAGDAIRIEASGPESGPWQVHAKLTLAELAFTNSAGSLAGENISLVTEAQGVVDLKHPGMTFSATFEAKAGEALYERYYLNLAKNPVVATCSGSYQFDQTSFQLTGLRFDLTDILPLEINGFINQEGSERNADFDVNIPKVSLKPIFHHLLLEPFKAEMPLLATLETEGAFSAAFKVKETENTRQITGQIGWRQGALVLPDRGISLKGIHLDLPLWYQTGLAQAPVDKLKGKFEVQSVTVPLLPEQPLSILLDAGPNKISIDSPTVIRVPGGDLLLGPIQVKNVFDPELSVHTSLAFEKIDLQSLLSGVATIPTEGILTGTLNPVRYEKQRVTSQGEIEAKVFGGKIILSDIGASGLLTSAPVFRINAKWDDLLLAEMTTDTAFGKIEGLLKGHIRDFEIAYGQPQKFALLLETVKTKGIPQTISIKAIDNIAQIGGGQSPFMGLAGTFASVFKKFPYEKIGMRARLENDMFTINGTIREDGTEYLVKRRGFSGVNIVNQNPDNRISLKDMVKRIKRITQGEAVVE